MERVLEFFAGLAASGPAVFDSCQPAAIESPGAFGQGHCAHYTSVRYDKANEYDDQRKQPIERGPGFAGYPTTRDDPNEHGNANVAQPKMLALELRRRRFTLLQPAL